MPIATPEIYAEMIDRAKAGSFAYPAINITSSSTVTAAIQGFAEAESDGIIQVSVGGAEYAAGSTIKDTVRVRYYITDMAHYDGLVEVAGKVFGEIRPAATMIVCGLTRPERKVEIEVTARLGAHEV